jgi:hypothetical protein
VATDSGRHGVDAGGNEERSESPVGGRKRTATIFKNCNVKTTQSRAETHLATTGSIRPDSENASTEKRETGPSLDGLDEANLCSDGGFSVWQGKMKGHIEIKSRNISFALGEKRGTSHEANQNADHETDAGSNVRSNRESSSLQRDCIGSRGSGRDGAGTGGTIALSRLHSKLDGNVAMDTQSGGAILLGDQSAVATKRPMGQEPCGPHTLVHNHRDPLIKVYDHKDSETNDLECDFGTGISCFGDTAMSGTAFKVEDTPIESRQRDVATRDTECAQRDIEFAGATHRTNIATRSGMEVSEREPSMVVGSNFHSNCFDDTVNQGKGAGSAQTSKSKSHITGSGNNDGDNSAALTILESERSEAGLILNSGKKRRSKSLVLVADDRSTANSTQEVVAEETESIENPVLPGGLSGSHRQ